MAQVPQSSDNTEMVVIECDSNEGITIGLIDGIIAQVRVLQDRDLSSTEVKEALKDMKYCILDKLEEICYTAFA